MKLLIKNEGEFAVKVLTRSANNANSGDADPADNGMKEITVEPNGFANVDAGPVAEIIVREYTPLATPEADLYSGGGD